MLFPLVLCELLFLMHVAQGHISGHMTVPIPDVTGYSPTEATDNGIWVAKLSLVPHLLY